jgi:hypothetical protein
MAIMTKMRILVRGKEGGTEWEEEKIYDREIEGEDEDGDLTEDVDGWEEEEESTQEDDY